MQKKTTATLGNSRRIFETYFKDYLLLGELL